MAYLMCGVHFQLKQRDLISNVSLIISGEIVTSFFGLQIQKNVGNELFLLCNMHFEMQQLLLTILGASIIPCNLVTRFCKSGVVQMCIYKWEKDTIRYVPLRFICSSV